MRSVTLINEISLGHVGFAIIGAYSQALLVMKAGLPFWPALILSGLLAAVIALLLGHPFLKVKGIYFSILTLLTAETFRLVVYYWTSLTGGSLGLVGVPAPEPDDPVRTSDRVQDHQTTTTTSPSAWSSSPC